MRISNTCMKKCDTKMTYQKAIDVLKMENDLMQFNPMTGETVPIEFYNKDNNLIQGGCYEYTRGPPLY